MKIGKYHLQYCHVPRKTGVSETICLLCDEPIVADMEWYVWITKDDMDAKNKRKADFMRPVAHEA